MRGMIAERRLARRQGAAQRAAGDHEAAKREMVVEFSGLGARNDDWKGEGAWGGLEAEVTADESDDSSDSDDDDDDNNTSNPDDDDFAAAGSKTTAAPALSADPAPTGSFRVEKHEHEHEHEHESEHEDSDNDEKDLAETLTADTPSPSPSPTSSLFAPAALRSHDAGSPIGIPPPYPPPPPKPAMSETTEHVLIAVAAIVVTLIVTGFILGFYVMRRNGLTLRDVFNKSKRGRSRPDRTIDISRPAPQALRFNAYVSPEDGWNKEYGAAPSAKDHPLPPQPSITRSDTSLSKSGRHHTEFLSPSYGEPTTPIYSQSNRSFLEEETPPRRGSARHTRDISDASLNLPIQKRSLSIKRNNQDSEPPVLPRLLTGPSPETDSLRGEDDFVSPNPPAPTFQQFLANRPGSRRMTASKSQQPMASHFSWTTAQTPTTPRDPSRESGLSVASSHSSVGRFRTVDSWVGAQTNRLPSMQLRGGLEQLNENEARSQFEVPDVPGVPEMYKDHNGHQRNPSDATVFRQHPGTEVVIPRGSLVPSEILNERTYHSAL
ncbi:uncharacterized protein K452DRAFT_320934 [Aplosporella prunicola CBS 121167]|uniref:Uncharacterized protein n=1 Tax=Aplosporella prunicola CBS 121167 TaxID=1176127 RepID=A0A6A6B3N9_9PEZI|nr:uncharacterized protein K452DRAFT_320934 [Aplosporella prunicola CBS 121167]KAF2138829.1 hypothetical protein K452DRAFT_320934 [Aplosporella prunicola CBS 121167]